MRRTKRAAAKSCPPPAPPPVEPTHGGARCPTEPPHRLRLDRWDIICASACFAAALAGYTATLAPTVTLEDSGELIVAADYLGVPHPPGYPLWTLLAWLCSRVFAFVTFHGHPNPAWGVAFLSALSAAAACGLVALLVRRSGALWLHKINPAAPAGLTAAAGVAAGLLLAFSPVLWSQAVIAEVYALNALFVALILWLAFEWLRAPTNRLLYWTAFLFGGGLANHQTLVFIAPGLLLAVAARDRRLFRDLALAGAILAGAYGLWLKTGATELAAGALALLSLAGAMPLLHRLGGRWVMSEWRRIAWVTLLASAGLAIYIYLPMASRRDPPMNWGYPQTWEAFKAVLFRAQYEPVSAASVLADPGRLVAQLREFVYGPASVFSIPGQFTLALALLGLLPLAAGWRAGALARRWLAVLAGCFLLTGVVFMVVQNPDLSVADSLVKRVQYIPAHMVYAVLIGYGLLMAGALMLRVGGSPRWLAVSLAAAVLALPTVPILRNAYDNRLLDTVGAADQLGHAYGWQFGAYQLDGAKAIRDDLRPGDPPPPDADYPPPMEPGAILFGGTDPGRFVPTYMIYSARLRPDINLITQNALANACYLDELRGIFREAIWTPGLPESNTAFRLFYEQAASGQIPFKDSVAAADGRINVRGAEAVMWINGVLAGMIFDRNKSRHAFYVEESYVIPWMYPYLTPHGLIMKLNPEPVAQLDPALVARDHAFWGWYTDRLLSQPAFRRDVMAQRSFSKLRTAQAGLYAARNMAADAERAYREALRLYPLNLEARLRLVQQVLLPQGRFAESAALLDEHIAKDPHCAPARAMRDQARALAAANQRRQDLESGLARGGSLADAMELCRVYLQLQALPRFTTLASQIENVSNLPFEVSRSLAGMLHEARQFEPATRLLRGLATRYPFCTPVWLELAAAHLGAGQSNACRDALAQAVRTGGDGVRDQVARDPRLAPCAPLLAGIGGP